MCREHGQDVIDKLILEGKATAIEVGNAVFVKIRHLEWSENTNINRGVSLGGVSQGPAALGSNVDLDSLATMFDDMISHTQVTTLDMGDARLLRIQQSTRDLSTLGQTRTGQIHGIPMVTAGTKIMSINEQIVKKKIYIYKLVFRTFVFKRKEHLNSFKMLLYQK